MRLFVVLTLLASVCVASPRKEEEAVRAAVDAALKQSGLQQQLDQLTNEYVNKPLNKYVLPHLGPYAPILGTMKVVVDQKVELKWEF